MSKQPGTQSDLKSAIFNPGFLTREALSRSFVARKKTLTTLEQELRESGESSAGQQHRLFYGPRGMGKTTLLLRLQYLVEDDAALSRRWCPVSFLEEKYGIGDLADFWLEVLSGLPMSAHEKWPEKLAERLKARYRDDAERLSAAAFDALKRWSQQEKRHILLLIDNLNDVFDHISDERQQHQLRAILMEAPWLKLIGFSPTYFEQLERTDAPFYEFFSVERLEAISLEETREILEAWSTLDQRPELLERLAQRQGRIKNLHLLTGGNPRLVAVIYEMLKEGPLSSTLEDVEKLVDRMTPYFKSQVDGLPVQSRRLVDALAKHWEPVATKVLADDMRLPSNQVSAQLSRLKRDGWVTQRGDGKHATHQLADRFYNIYHLMRSSRSQLQRLKGFVKFLQIFFEDEDLRKLAEGIKSQLKEHPAENPQDKAAQLARLSMIAEATTDPTQKSQLYSDAFELARSLTGEEYRLEELVDLPLARQVLGDERIEAEAKIRSLEEEKKEGTLPFDKLQNLANLYARVGDWVHSEECWRSCLKKKPGEDGLVYNVAHALLQQGKLEECLNLLNTIQTADANVQADALNLRGVILLRQGDLKKAEAAYRESLKHRWSALVATNLVQILLSQGRESEAQKLLEKNANNRDADASQLLLLYLLANKRGDDKNAEQYIRRAAEKDGFCGFVLAAHFRKLNRTAQVKKALKEARARLGKTTRPPQFFASLHTALFQLQAWDEAEELSRHQEEIEGSCKGLGRLNRVLGLAVCGKMPDAEKSLQEAFDKGLSAHDAAWWGDHLNRSGQYVLALKCGWYAVQRDNGLPKGYLALSASYCNQNHFDKAHDCAVKALSLDSGIGWGHRLRAISAARLGLWEEVYTAASQLVKTEPKKPLTWLLMYEAAVRCNQMGNLDELESQIRLMLPNVEAAINTSHETIVIGLSNAGVLSAKNGTLLDDKNALIWNNYSAGLRAIGRNNEALNAAKTAISLEPLHILAWRNYFGSAHALGEEESIIRGVETLLATPGLGIDRVSQVVQALMDLKLNERVIQLASGFRSIHPNVHQTLTIEAAALIRLNRWEEARTLLQTIPADSSDIAEAMRLRFLCACHIKSLAEAKAAWVGIAPDFVQFTTLLSEVIGWEFNSNDGWSGLPTFLLATGDLPFKDGMRPLGAFLGLASLISHRPARLTQLLETLKDAEPELEQISLPLTTWSAWCEALIHALSPSPDSDDQGIDWETQLEETVFPLEKSHPQAAQDLWRLAAHVLTTQAPDAATWCWGEVLRLLPKDVEALDTLAQRAKAEGDRHKELIFLRKLIQQDTSDLELGIRLVECLLSLGQLSEADVQLKRLRKLHPYSFKTRLYHLLVLYYLSRTKEAEQLFEQLTLEQPLNERPWGIRYRWLLTQRNPVNDRIHWLEQGLDQIPSSRTLTHAWAKEQLAVPPSSEEALRSIEQRVQLCFIKHPDDPLARELQALLLLARGRWREALGVLDSLLQVPETLQAHEKPLMDLALLVGAHGKPLDVAAVLIERGLEENWQPLVLALQLTHDPTLAARTRVPEEILKVAEGLRDSLVNKLGGVRRRGSHT